MRGRSVWKTACIDVNIGRDTGLILRSGNINMKKAEFNASMFSTKKAQREYIESVNFLVKDRRRR